MKKFLFLIVILCVGCSNNYVLNCSYTNYNDIYGESLLVDTLYFKSNQMVHYIRSETVNLYSDNKRDIKSVYRIKKSEGKLFKKLVAGGKYKVSKKKNIVNLKLILKINSDSDLSNIGLNINNDYEEMKANYNSLGFQCK